MKVLLSHLQLHPLRSLLLIALVPRLIAVFASQGYGMHDDHFGPIEQPFIIMHDSSYWENRGGVHGHSIVYPALHYGLFYILKGVGIVDPKKVMLLVRLLHALYSLLIVYFGYRIVRHLSSAHTAWYTGVVLALFWPFPFISVRNLIEVVCIPPIMAGMYYALRANEGKKYAWWSGILFGLGFVFRYQTILMPMTIGIFWLFQKRWRETSYLALGGITAALLIQGSADTFAWGYPFAAVLEYTRYNLTHSTEYTTGNWYNYLLLLIGAFIPPMSFFLLYGYVREWKRSSLIFFSTLAFFLFLSLFPNKQERFVFSVVPQILMLSVMGWVDLVKLSRFWERNKWLVKGLWGWFWVINIVLLVVFSTYYSKRARVETMYYLYGKHLTGFVLVAGDVGITQMPQFYTGQYTKCIFEIHSDAHIDSVVAKILTAGKCPNYVICFGPKAIERKEKFERSLGRDLLYEATIQPSFLDNVFYQLNPRFNKNQTIYIFRIHW
ncbi:MAG: glycosyltransferase family 39 protein [Bacteroidetes bacterium]|nr:glycosyltransferase family 39 protein [Bacteroidota bacterium]